MKNGFYQRIGKRLLDVVVSVAALAILSPLLILTASIVRIFLGAPILFLQRRAGLHGRPFTLVKFRTMRETTSVDGHRIPDDQRLSRLGSLLRTTSVDELPELFNVLRGDMSLVGPRPLLMKYLPRYDDRQARRHDVRPGITGLAQVNGRSNLTFAKRFEFDVHYVDNFNLTLDLRVLLLTLWKVLVQDDSSLNTDEFMGTRPHHRQ